MNSRYHTHPDSTTNGRAPNGGIGGVGAAQPQELLDRDYAEWCVADRLRRLQNAWDAELFSSDEWRQEQARMIVSTVLTLLGHGTPTMRGEYCGFAFPDGAQCIYGRHHEVRTHLHPLTGTRQGVTAR